MEMNVGLFHSPKKKKQNKKECVTLQKTQKKTDTDKRKRDEFLNNTHLYSLI